MIRRGGMNTNQARLVFFSVWGDDPPWTCFVCGDEIWSREKTGAEVLNVHHINEDSLDDRPSNLDSCHKGCHTVWHDRIRALVREAEASVYGVVRAWNRVGGR
jgi:hypothetical protein